MTNVQKSESEMNEQKLDHILDMELAFKKRVDRIDRKTKKNKKIYNRYTSYWILLAGFLIGSGITAVAIWFIYGDAVHTANQLAIMKALNITPVV